MSEVSLQFLERKASFESQLWKLQVIWSVKTSEDDRSISLVLGDRNVRIELRGISEYE